MRLLFLDESSRIGEDDCFALGGVAVAEDDWAGDPWSAGTVPGPVPLRPLPPGAVLKRLGPSGTPWA